jgi:hypothetical protein
MRNYHVMNAERRLMYCFKKKTDSVTKRIKPDEITLTRPQITLTRPEIALTRPEIALTRPEIGVRSDRIGPV